MADDTKNSEGMETKRPEGEAEPRGGPAKRQEIFLAERYDVLIEKEKEKEKIEIPKSMLRADLIPEISDTAPAPEPWLLSGAPALQAGFQKERIRLYREHQLHKLQKTTLPASTGLTGVIPEPPAPPPANNWIPIGPSVLRKGQAA
ncbi:MAG: hypothetical protein PVG60_06155, partial [Desulfarculaceae bacterium]